MDDDDIRVAVVLRAVVAGRLQQSGHLLGVVIVHLAAVGLDQVLAAHVRPFARRPSLSPFALRSSFALRRAASISAALARTPSVTAAPAIILASSNSRLAPSSRATFVVVRPSRTCFVIWNCTSPCAAICGRWVMESTCDASAGSCSLLPTPTAALS